MNWITDVVRPKIGGISGLWQKRQTPDNLWIKCPETGEMVFHQDLENNQWVVPSSGHHMRLASGARLKLFFDGGAFDEIDVPDVATDPLKFRAEKRYIDQIKDDRAKTGMKDAVRVAVGQLEENPVTVGVQDFSYRAGSLGLAAGEGIVTALETAVKRETPCILFTASGGARMQEGTLSLMQLPRTTVAVSRLKEAGLPYIVVLTNPTTGGVTASYAMLGDIHLAEPGALITFAGPRVIEQTVREKLPEGFQRSEYLHEHGMIDQVVHRHELRPTIARLCRMMMKQPARDATPRLEPPEAARDDAAAEPADA